MYNNAPFNCFRNVSHLILRIDPAEFRNARFGGHFSSTAQYCDTGWIYEATYDDMLPLNELTYQNTPVRLDSVCVLCFLLIASGKMAPK